MSLVGSLDDLGLGDILQIVSMARKSGLLVLRSASGEGRILFRDGMVRALGMQLDSNRQRTLIRIALIVVLLASYVVSVVYRGDLVYLLLAAYGPVVQFAPAVVATLYWRRASAAGVLAGLISGGCVNLLFFLWPALRPFEVHAGLYGLAINAPALIAVSLLTTRSLSEPESQFLATAKGE